jgi:hypothetical protein
VRIRPAAVVLAAITTLLSLGCQGGGLFGKQYEYEEDLTLDIDGSATIVVNASLPALAALRGLEVPTDPAARVDRDQIRAMFETPVTDVTRVSRPWRRSGRNFVQVRVSVDDVSRLGEAPPFSWSKYAFVRKDDRVVYSQTVGPSAMKPGSLANYGWNGSEIVAFRVHVPSRIQHHTARDLETDEPTQASRGNILSWEQHLADRLDGQPVNVLVEMESESILHQTLWLFAGAFTSAVVVLVLLIWWTMRKGKDEEQTEAQHLP